MKIIADFHIHSKYSRATSPQMDLEHLNETAKIKGVQVISTGDFTHPTWFRELKDKLKPAEQGLSILDKTKNATRFILTSEISCIYSKAGKVRKVHILIFAPDLATVEKINARLAAIGNLKADGRPILGLDAKELLKIALEVNPDCLVVPSHCLLPEAYIHDGSGIKMIKDISMGDYVFTHKGRLRKVEKVYRRFYQGKIYAINPFYFRLGLKTTSEHPFYAIKSERYCPTAGCKIICKKDCAYIKHNNCRHKYFEKYVPQWISAKDLKEGDVLIFPRFVDNTKDIQTIKISDYLSKKGYRMEGNFIRCDFGTRANLVPNVLKIDKDFCRLAGYYLSEGYTDSRDSVSFCFNSTEKAYADDVKNLMKSVFRLPYCREVKRHGRNSIELIFFSKILSKFFGEVFYNNSLAKKANTKCLPGWALNLSLDKQAEILKGWWRGDTGYTSSRVLMNQFKIICLRLGIIPSIGIQRIVESFNEGNHRIGERLIKTNQIAFHFSNLSFFEDRYGLLQEPCFKKFNTKLKRRHGWIDEKYIYIPIRDIKTEDYKGDVYNLEVKEDNSYVAEFATIHNCWTPWFAVFGSKSGFDSLEECFEEQTKNIFAIETGMSSDPAMNWRLSALDKVALISCSDAHSAPKIGREACVFDTEMSYPAIVEAIKSKNPKKFLSTIEFFPEEGKYHYDGHRLCNVRFSPGQTKKYRGLCPVCGRPLTVGVLNRVEELADRPEGFVPPGAIPYKCLIPLSQIIGEALNVGESSKSVKKVYDILITKLGSELTVLMDSPLADIEKNSGSAVALAVQKMREGKVNIEPGYDGVYGKVGILSGSEKKDLISHQGLLF